MQRDKQISITYQLDNEYIYLTYDESLLTELTNNYKPIKNRIFAIDLNPNYIGLSILEFQSDNSFKVLYKRVFDLSELNEQSTNKIKYELQQIDNEILKLCKHFKVSKLVVEDLKFKKSNKFWSKKLNTL